LFATVWALAYGTVITNTIAMAANAAIAILFFLVNLTILFFASDFFNNQLFAFVFKKEAALLMCTRNVH